MLAPYKAATWADIPDANKEATGLWTNDYTGFETIGYDAKLGTITKVADLADPKYKGKVALNGDPLKAGRPSTASSWRPSPTAARPTTSPPASTSSRSSPTSGNLLPVDPTPATIASGQTPIVIDWTYNNNARSRPSRRRASTGRSSSDGRAAGGRVLQRSDQQGCPASRGRPLLGRVRLLRRGQNTWLKGFALPVRLAAMQKAGTIDKAAFDAINPPTTPPVQLTQAQPAAATKYLTDNWKFISIK